MDIVWVAVMLGMSVVSLALFSTNQLRWAERAATLLLVFLMAFVVGAMIGE